VFVLLERVCSSFGVQWSLVVASLRSLAQQETLTEIMKEKIVFFLFCCRLTMQELCEAPPRARSTSHVVS
jgi:hypothetical protein